MTQLALDGTAQAIAAAICAALMVRSAVIKQLLVVRSPTRCAACRRRGRSTRCDCTGRS
jgi:hypothetical protein